MKKNTVIVQFTRYFEEFGFEDCDTKEFDNLKDAYQLYCEIEETKEDRFLQLWFNGDRIL